MGHYMQRVFVTRAKAGQLKGDHAHRRCAQLLVCVSGRIQVVCDDGRGFREHLLDDMSPGLLIPPGVWAKQYVLEDDAVLIVLCDRGFEVEDYIRDYDEFRAFLVSASTR